MSVEREINMVMRIDYYTLLLKAYKKLKNYAYYEKTDLKLKEAISSFEYTNEKDKNKVSSVLNRIELIAKRLTEKDDSILDSIRTMNIKLYPKSVKENDGKIIVEKLLVDVSSYDLFISYLIGFAWIILYGSKLDRGYSSNLFGNRLKDDFDLELEKETYNVSTFKPYFKQFTEWRNNAIEEITKDGEKTLVNLDLKNFYYNIKLDWNKINTEIGIDEDELIHTYVRSYIEKYESLFYPSKGLPIFFPPSRILSNYALKEFDQLVMSNDKVTYYGRYVDDIIFILNGKYESYEDVFFNESTGFVNIFKLKLTTNNISEIIANHVLMSPNLKDSQRYEFLRVFNHLKPNQEFSNYECAYKELDRMIDYIKDKNPKIPNSLYSLKEAILSTESLLKFTILNDDYEIQKDKIRIFSNISKNGDRISYEKLQAELVHDSSDFANLAEFDDDINSITSKIFQNPSPVLKFRELDEVELSKYELSKFVGQLSLDIEYYQNVEIDQEKYGKHIELLYGIMKNSTVIDNRLQWEKIFSVLYKLNKQNQYNIYDNIGTAIKNIVVNQDIYDYGLGLNNSKIKTLLRETMTEYLEIANEIGSGSSFKKSKENIYTAANMCRYANLVNPIKNYLNISENYDNFKLTFAPIYIDYGLIQKQEIDRILRSKRPFDINSVDYKKLYKDYIVINYYYNSSIGKVPDSEFSNLKEVVINTMSDIDNGDISNLKFLFKQSDRNLDLTVALSSISGLEKTLSDNIESQMKKEKFKSECDIKSIKNILNHTNEQNIDLLLFPETSIPFFAFNLLYKKSKHAQIGIVFGTRHIVVKKIAYNIAWTLLPFINEFYVRGKLVRVKHVMIIPRIKNVYSPLEEKMINDKHLKTPQETFPSYSWNKYDLFSWRNVDFTVYNCHELSNIQHRALFVNKLDLFIAIEFNRDVSYFSNIVESMARDLYVFFAQVNISNYGDSRITRPTSSYDSDMCRIKGGDNEFIVVTKLDIAQLRKEQKILNSTRMKGKNFGNDTKWKPTPAGYDRDI